LGPTPEERLRLFHAVGDEDNLDSSYAKINYEQVLDIDIYFELEDKLVVSISSFVSNNQEQTFSTNP
jgi:hypothetical protein